jgi:hypothetical protein
VAVVGLLFHITVVRKYGRVLNFLLHVMVVAVIVGLDLVLFYNHQL